MSETSGQNVADRQAVRDPLRAQHDIWAPGEAKDSPQFAIAIRKEFEARCVVEDGHRHLRCLLAGGCRLTRWLLSFRILSSILPLPAYLPHQKVIADSVPAL